MMDKVSSRQLIAQLVERFSNNHKFYTSQQYNETEARVQFVNPFFEALGWDIADSTGRHEVFHEDIVEVEEEGRKRAKRPDYGFRLHNQIRFFVETKKPSVNLRSNPIPAFQVRRYGWSARLPISILTDFEEFIIYDCRIQPNENDQPSKGRLRYYTYTEYLDKWDEIYDLLSYEAVQANKLEAWVQESKQRGTVTVDDAFLNEMEEWRKRLAEDIAMNNPTLTRRQLNMAVQATIDRIVFLRICEDRGIEPNGRLKDFGRGSGVYANLTQLFRQADAKYNSGLFHFREEKDREEPDNITLTLTISDDILQDIISRLYYPSPYAFSVIPADILGQIYERFLGKVIELTPGGGAEVVEKPEVRKAGGVYYTPTYIVDYIVSNTVGQLVEGKTPDSVAALRILDPACGSGSFLIGAYQYLLDWHLDYYSKHDPNRHLKAKKVRTLNGEGSGYALTTAEKKRILINNIYGVDLDQQAVEVTKLSLLLKVLEGETAATAQPQLMAERVLPDLGENIKWGNSLIGPDYYIGKQIALFDEEELDRVKTFDWYSKAGGFGEIMSDGGFDVVIGNPPYVRQEILGENFKNYAILRYKTYAGTADLYAYFIEKSINLLKPNGIFSMIVANKWMRATYGTSLRNWLKTQCITEVIDFGDLQVFRGATTYPCIIRISRAKPNDYFRSTKVETLEFSSLQNYVNLNFHNIQQSKLQDSGWSLTNKNTQDLLIKIEKNNIPLSQYLGGEVHYGIKTGYNEAFVIDEQTRNVLISEDPNSAEIIKPFVIGRDVGRYTLLDNRRYLIFTRRGIDITKYPAIERHLSKFKEKLLPKPKGWKGEWGGRKPGSYQWYEIQDTVDYYVEFEKPKIMYLVFQVKPTFTIDLTGKYANNAVWIIPRDDKYLLGILNSKLGWFLISNLCTQIQNGFQLIFQYLRKLPIPTINFEHMSKQNQYKKLTESVEIMLTLHEQLANAPNDSAHKTIQSLIDSTDREIDNLVYELYDLTPEEIALIEG